MGGLETHVFDLCKALHRRGHQAILHSPFIEDTLRNRLERIGVIFTSQPENEKFDIIHGHPWTWGLLRSLEISIYTARPLVVTYHGLYRVVWDELRRHNAQVIAVSPEVRAHLGHGVVIENGVDIEWFKPEGAKLPGKPFAISFVGRLGDDRWRALKVLAELADAFDFLLHVVGDHQSLQYKPLLAHKRIVWHGPVADIRPVLRESHIVFSTGRGIREAMASGRPAAVLNSRHYDGVVTPENVNRLRYHNFSGRATRRNPTADTIATDIERLVSDREHWLRLTAWCRRYAEEHFSLDKMVILHEEAYLRCLDGSSREC